MSGFNFEKIKEYIGREKDKKNEYGKMLMFGESWVKDIWQLFVKSEFRWKQKLKKKKKKAHKIEKLYFTSFTEELSS